MDNIKEQVNEILGQEWDVEEGVEGPDEDSEVIRMMNEKYALVYIDKNIFVIDESGAEVSFRRPEAFKLDMANKTVIRRVRKVNKKGKGDEYTFTDEVKSVYDIWMKHPMRRQYHRVDFIPQWTNEERPQEREVYNLWRGFEVQGKHHEEGLTDLYWDHVKQVICDGDEELYMWTRKWLAHAIQRPWEKPRTALVLRSGEGTGKDTFIQPLGDIFGKHYYTTSDIERLVGHFNGHLVNAVLIYAREALWGGNKAAQSKIKELITDSRVSFERKGIDAFSANSCARLIVSSNEAWAVPAGIDDRRFVFYEVSDIKRDDTKYFKRLYQLVNRDEFKEQLVWDLQREEIASFIPSVRPTDNSKKGFDIKLLSMNSVQRFVYEWLNEAGSVDVSSRPIDDGAVSIEIDYSEMYQAYTFWCKHNLEKHVASKVAFSNEVFGKGTRRGLLPIMSRQRKRANQHTLVKIIRLPSMHACRKYFEEKVMRHNIEWDVEVAAPILIDAEVIQFEKHKESSQETEEEVNPYLEVPETVEQSERRRIPARSEKRMQLFRELKRGKYDE